MTEPTEAMKRAAAVWVDRHYGKPLGNFCQGSWNAARTDYAHGMADAAALIEAWLRGHVGHDFKRWGGDDMCGVIRQGIADAIARGAWLPDPLTPEPDQGEP